jgi:hypothetical protein
VEAEGGTGENVKPRNEVRTPRVSAPGAGGVKGRGGVAPAPRRRETAEASKAEVGKTRVHALPESQFNDSGGEGIRKRSCPVREGGKGGEEAMSEDKKPKFKRKTIELTGWVVVKPRQESQKKPETERREDIKRRINEELEFLMEMEDRMPRKDEKKHVDYETEQMEQMIELCVDGAMADLRRALLAEELEIYEKCYRFFKRTSSKIIRDYAAEQILRRAANLRGEG